MSGAAGASSGQGTSGGSPGFVGGIGFGTIADVDGSMRDVVPDSAKP